MERTRTDREDGARTPLRSIAAWVVLFATPLLWSAHLTLLYLVASVEITLRREAGAPTQVFSALATLAALFAIGVLGWAMHERRFPHPDRLREDLAALWHRAGTFLAVLSFLGVLWQGLVAIAVPGAPVSHHAMWGGTAAPEWVQRERAEEATGDPPVPGAATPP